jgi:hypothetical protein
MSAANTTKYVWFVQTRLLHGSIYAAAGTKPTRETVTLTTNGRQILIFEDSQEVRDVIFPYLQQRANKIVQASLNFVGCLPGMKEAMRDKVKQYDFESLACVFCTEDTWEEDVKILRIPLRPDFHGSAALADKHPNQ